MIISKKVKEHHKLIFLRLSLFVLLGRMCALNSIPGQQRKTLMHMEMHGCCYTPAVHSLETAVEQKCCDVSCFLWPVSAISGDVCLCCCLFLVHQLFNLSNKWRADDQARQTPDGRFAYKAFFFFFTPLLLLISNRRIHPQSTLQPGRG